MEKIDAKDMFKTFWMCRDLEIQHYWHRIVFMTAFLVGSFTAYGGWIGLAVSERGKLPFAVGNGVGFYIAIVGIVVSALWIMMAKGSKAWYAEYEHVIEAFMKKEDLSEDVIHEYMGLEYYNFPSIEAPDVNDFLWSAKAGTYSVSKIGIAIGHVSVVIWGIICLMHLTLAKTCISWTQAVDRVKTKYCDCHGLVVVGTALLLLFWLYSKKCLFSSYFKKWREEV